MHDFQDEVLELLTESVGSAANALDPFLKRHSQESDFYSRLFLSVARARLDEDDAREHFTAMVSHHDRLTGSLGRPVDFRVTVLDYLVSHPDVVKMPGIRRDLEGPRFAGTRRDHPHRRSIDAHRGQCAAAYRHLAFTIKTI